MHAIITSQLIEKEIIEFGLGDQSTGLKIIVPKLFKIYKEQINKIFKIHYDYIYTDLDKKYLPLMGSENSLTKIIYESMKYGKLIGPKEFNHVLSDILLIFQKHDTLYSKNEMENLGSATMKWEKYKPSYISWITAGTKLHEKYGVKDTTSENMKLKKLEFKGEPVCVQCPEYEFQAILKKTSKNDILILISMLKASATMLEWYYVK